MSAFGGLRQSLRTLARTSGPMKSLVPNSGRAGTGRLGAARRGMATEEKVTWAEYRSGAKDLQQWIDANRPVVVVGVFVGWYVLIKGASMAFGGKKETPAIAEPAK